MSRSSRRIRPGTLACYLILSILAVLTLAPLYFLLVNSFKPQAEIVRDPLALPADWGLQYLASAADQINFWRALGATAMLTAASLVLIVLASSMAAWMLVRNKHRLSGAVFLLFVSAMLIPFQSIMYPMLNFMDSLGLKNLGGLVLMYGGFGLSLSVFLYHGFIKSVPQGVEEAAVIDGAGILQVFFGVVFPLLKSTTVTVIILNGMWIWNDYLLPFLVIGNSGGMKTLTLELYFAKMLSGQFGSPWELIFPAVLVSVLPVIAVFLCLQRYFIKGISDGAVKA